MSNIYNGGFCKISLWRNPVNYFRKNFRLRCFSGFYIRFCCKNPKTQQLLLMTADLISLGMSQNIYLSNISIVFTTILGTLSFGHLEITHHLISIFNTFKVRLLGLLVNNLLLQILIALSTNIFYEIYSC